MRSRVIFVVHNVIMLERWPALVLRSQRRGVPAKTQPISLTTNCEMTHVACEEFVKLQPTNQPTKEPLNSTEPICMRGASGIGLQQCDRQEGRQASESCHGVCQQVSLAGISRASKPFQGLRSDGGDATQAFSTSDASRLFQGLRLKRGGGESREILDRKPSA